MRKVLIIAEAGVNHNGSLSTAKRLVDAAAVAGADAVKFQTFHAESVISRYAPKARYQKTAMGGSESQLKMVKRLELGIDAHKALLRYCRKKKIAFLSSPFDLESIDLLAHLGLKLFKVPSGEITNLPYLRKIGSLRKSVILSTGMATLREIRGAIGILLSRGTGRRNIIVLHCNTEYPTPFEDVNLLAMTTMEKRLGVRVGYSDHTIGIDVPMAAVALGATVIEKHLTLDKNMRGPDHKASLECEEFKKMVRGIRNVELALGSGIKCPSGSEIKNIPIVRKSIVANRAINKGEILNSRNISVKRPGTGISPMEWDNVIGLKARKSFKRDELIRL